ncbi:MAG: SIMPL domain-containing protein [Pseudomonadota bacterium]
MMISADMFSANRTASTADTSDARAAATRALRRRSRTHETHQTHQKHATLGTPRPYCVRSARAGMARSARASIVCAFVFALAAACAAPTPSNAETAGAVGVRTIVVSGDGQAFGEPDIARLTIGVETRAASAREAIAENNRQIGETIARLKQSGVDAKDMQTAAISVNPQYDYSGRDTPRLTGYTAGNALSVTLRDLDKAGATLDAALGAGANRLNGFRFDFADPGPLRDAARVAAVKDGQRKARLLADAAGVALGPLLQINDGAQPAVVAQPTVALQRAEASAVPIERGESGLTARVTLIFEIRD